MKKVEAGGNHDSQRHLGPKNTREHRRRIRRRLKRTTNHMTCTNLATAHEVSHGTIHNILQDNLGLVKKPAQWAPKLVSEDQKQQRMEICKRFIAVFSPNFIAMLENILVMDKTLVSYHAYVTKKQPEQWIRTENQGGVHAAPNRCLAFFGSWEATFNLNYILSSGQVHESSQEEEDYDYETGVVLPLG